MSRTETPRFAISATRASNTSGVRGVKKKPSECKVNVLTANSRAGRDQKNFCADSQCARRRMLLPRKTFIVHRIGHLDDPCPPLDASLPKWNAPRQRRTGTPDKHPKPPPPKPNLNALRSPPLSPSAPNDSAISVNRSMPCGDKCSNASFNRAVMDSPL